MKISVLTQLKGKEKFYHLLGGHHVHPKQKIRRIDSYNSQTLLYWCYTLFPGTKWQYIGENKTIGLANSSGNNVLSSGGSDSIKLTEAQLPAHNHSFSGTAASAGGHTHNKGTMNITGAFALGGGKSEGEAPGFASGVFSKTTRALKVNTASGTVNSTVTQINMNAASAWAGDTSISGAHTHTVSGTIGNKGGNAAVTVTNAYIMLMGWYRIS